MEGYMAEIRMFAGDFTPRNWAYCAGQTMSIASNNALFALLGTTYGGNGIQTFCLPNMCGRTPLSPGTSTTNQNYQLGQISGVENVTLLSNNMPAHTHQGGQAIVRAIAANGSNSNPSGNTFAQPTAENADTGETYVVTAYNDGSSSPTFVNMNTSELSVQLAPAGNSNPHSNLQPYLVMNFIICMYGIFPSRN